MALAVRTLSPVTMTQTFLHPKHSREDCMALLTPGLHSLKSIKPSAGRIFNASSPFLTLSRVHWVYANAMHLKPADVHSKSEALHRDPMVNAWNSTLNIAWGGAEKDTMNHKTPFNGTEVPKIYNDYGNESMEFLVPQNNARAQVGEAPLVFDEKVEGYAIWWADQRKGDCQLIHSDGPFGENIFYGSGHDWTPSDAVNAWIEEKQYYNYETNSCSGDEMCGHYTQIVWKNSSRLGCARVICENGDVFMTCNYDPPGNYIGEKPY
eukprot:Gb_41624 [translate_table: standard]